VFSEPSSGAMTPHRIIAPITFATDSLEAASVAAELAASLGAELVLAGIAPLASPDPAPGAGGTTEAFTRRVREQMVVDNIVGERLEQFVGTLAPEIRARTLLTWGPVGAALVAAADDEEADLIVVPMRRENPLPHLFHDHADRYVLHHSAVPVLVVPTNVDGD
jgi:nucleotide-binding universal stress UspA family protein